MAAFGLFVGKLGEFACDFYLEANGMIEINQAKIRGAYVCIAGTLIVLLSGCATMDNWRFAKEVINTGTYQVKRVALLDVPIPEKVWLGWHLGTDLFGPLVSVATAGDDSDNPADASFVSVTTQIEMQNWLEKEGIEVILLKAERTNKTKMLEDYGQFSQVNADAILEIAPLFVGFLPSQGKQDVELSPDIAYKYRLLSTKDGQVLIESNVYYTSDVKGIQLWEKVAGDKRLGPREHIFEDVESVKKQPVEALRRLRFSIVGATEIISLKVKLFTN